MDGFIHSFSRCTAQRRRGARSRAVSESGRPRGRRKRGPGSGSLAALPTPPCARQAPLERPRGSARLPPDPRGRRAGNPADTRHRRPEGRPPPRSPARGGVCRRRGPQAGRGLALPPSAVHVTGSGGAGLEPGPGPRSARPGARGPERPERGPVSAGRAGSAGRVGLGSAGAGGRRPAGRCADRCAQAGARVAGARRREGAAVRLRAFGAGKTQGLVPVWVGFRCSGGRSPAGQHPVPLARLPSTRAYDGFVAVVDVFWSSWDLRVQIPGHIRACLACTGRRGRGAMGGGGRPRPSSPLGRRCGWKEVEFSASRLLCFRGWLSRHKLPPAISRTCHCFRHGLLGDHHPPRPCLAAGHGGSPSAS